VDLAGQLRQEQFAGGTIVVAERQIGDRMFIIDDGVAEVSTTSPKGSVSLGEIAVGEMFGEIALLSKIRRRKATVSALTHLVTLSLSAEAFEKTMRTYPQVLENFMAVAEALMNEKLLKVSVKK
jgi:CRP-like cAMP-binding protein